MAATPPSTGVIASQHYQQRAAHMVETNLRLGYTDLLVSQLASAMNDEANAVRAAYHMRCLVGVCLRLIERAKVKAQGR